MKINEKNKKLTTETFVILIFFIASTLYLYFFAPVANEKELIEIKGTLSNKPRYGKGNDDGGDEFVNFKLRENGKVYGVTGCGFKMLDFDNAINLNKGDSVIIKINGASIFNFYNKFFITEVQELYSNKNGLLLSIKDVNNCIKNSWKRVLLIGLTFVVIVAITSVRRIINNTNNYGKKEYEQ